jgi:hypothetical protein
VKDTTIPADLIELKARFDAWRASRKYVRQVSKRVLSSSNSTGMVESMTEPPKINFEIGGEGR